MTAFVQALCDRLDYAEAALATEMERLLVLVRPAVGGDESAADMKKAREHFQEQLPGAKPLLSKACWVLSLGVALVAQTAGALEAYDAGKNFASDLPKRLGHVEIVKSKVEETVPLENAATPFCQILLAARKLAPIITDH